MRYWKIDGEWGICIHGYEDMPSWDWRLFEGPIGGCLLNGIPTKDIVFNFFPNPTVSIEESTISKVLDFTIINNSHNKELKLNINNFDYSKTYNLEVFSIQGIKVLDLIIYNKFTHLNQSVLSQGLYIFTLKQEDKFGVQKVILR